MNVELSIEEINLLIRSLESKRREINRPTIKTPEDIAHDTATMRLLNILQGRLVEIVYNHQRQAIDANNPNE